MSSVNQGTKHTSVH